MILGKRRFEKAQAHPSNVAGSGIELASSSASCSVRAKKTTSSEPRGGGRAAEKHQGVPHSLVLEQQPKRLHTPHASSSWAIIFVSISQFIVFEHECVRRTESASEILLAWFARGRTLVLNLLANVRISLCRTFPTPGSLSSRRTHRGDTRTMFFYSCHAFLLHYHICQQVWFCFHTSRSL